LTAYHVTPWRQRDRYERACYAQRQHVQRDNRR
jgi:hypothetical protein